MGRRTLPLRWRRVEPLRGGRPALALALGTTVPLLLRLASFRAAVWVRLGTERGDLGLHGGVSSFDTSAKVRV